MLNSENKTYDLKKIIPVMFCRFSIDLSALKKCPILHIENLTSKKKKLGIKIIMNTVLISSILPTFLKCEIKKFGVSNVKFGIKGKISKF